MMMIHVEENESETLIFISVTEPGASDT